MSRKPRLQSETGIYHLILRGNNQQNLFLDKQDRLFIISKLKKYSAELDIDIYAYCLMSNHIHILVGNAFLKISLFVQKLANCYVYYFNRKYERTGHLFQGRFKSEPILDDKYFKTVFRYIIQNCEKANIERCDKYEWNSYSAIRDNNTDIINLAYLISIFGSIKNIINFLELHDTSKCMEYENKILLNDERALKIIRHLFKVHSPYTFQKLNIKNQILNCRLLKKEGLSINQISRLTGINKSIIRAA